jgi:hypothetical protein
MFNFIRIPSNWLQQSHRGTLSSILTFVAGWVIGMKLNAIIGAYLILVSSPLVIFYVLSEKSVRSKIIQISKIPLRRAAKFYNLMIVVLMITSIIIVRIPEWGNTIAFLAPNSDFYINQTQSYNNGQYDLIVECGTNQNETYNVNYVFQIVTFKLNNNWTGTVDKWWDSPHLKNRSNGAVYPLTSVIYQEEIPHNNTKGWSITPPTSNQDKWIEMSTVIVGEDTANAPMYVLQFGVTPIATDRSLYIEFKSNKPIQIKSARIDSDNFYTIGTKVIPQ